MASCAASRRGGSQCAADAVLRRAGRAWAAAGLGLLMGFMPPQPAAAQPCTAPGWPAWEVFKRQFVSGDGRVIDPSSPRQHTTSEGQAYGLFFALVANDRPAFDRLLRWTEDNLAAGDLASRLPAWQWGRRDDGTWQVLDANAASDADLWMAYALGEAGRLWQHRRYAALATLLTARIAHDEVRPLPGLGPVLLPGPVGFGPDAEGPRVRARLNASYLPPSLLQWFASRHGGLWHDVRQSALRVIDASAPKGFAADWVAYEGDATRQAGEFRLPDEAEVRTGSYDAIRVYLWVGVTSPADPARAALLQRLAPMAAQVERAGVPPEHVDPRELTVRGDGPAGFSAALLPFLAAAQRPAALEHQRQRTQPRDNAYYEQALALFGLGHHEARYRFERDGTLLPAWTTCTTPPSPSR
jgi:endoglucanase